MADDGMRVGGLSSGLAILLSGEDVKENSSKTHLVSYCDDFGCQPVERALEYIFGLPNKSVGPLTGPVDTDLVRSIIKNKFSKFHVNSDTLASNREGICIFDDGCWPHKVGLEESSICGDIRIVKPPFLLESLAMFSSTRANVFVWKGKWMYEVILETSGVQQLGWATLSCPFTDHKGVGDADDSYAFDGKRVKKWNKEPEPYGQSWVVGDVIGCCIDLDQDEILFYRNGVSLGVAFRGIRKMGPGFGYYPAISLSQGERCELNFGARPFKYPIRGFLPLQDPPSVNLLATQLLRCLSTMFDMQYMDRSDSSSVGKLRRLKRFVSLEELFYPVCHGVCEELFCILEADAGNIEYVAWGPLISFMMEVFRLQPDHDYSSLDRFIDVFLEFQESCGMFECVINALSSCCRTAALVLTECPYSGSYSYLALACHILRREELMVLWWKLPDFEFLFEGFLSQKSPSKQDLSILMPSVWWPGSCEDISYESSMFLTTTALSEAVNKASYYMSHQSQSISLLEETDKQIRERGCSEQLRRLKEVHNDYREEVINCVRHCAWYRISLFSRWKQRGMYATCMWIVQLLLVLSKVDSLFIYIPEFYLETLVNKFFRETTGKDANVLMNMTLEAHLCPWCHHNLVHNFDIAANIVKSLANRVDSFHVLRKSDPPFVPSAIFINQGLASFVCLVTFIVTHFNDPRILSADLKDLLLQSISVLVQYKEYVAVLESNEAATQRMPKALLSAFDNRSWIPVTNILLRLCKGSRFGSSKYGESSSSVVFQNLLREACANDEELFSAFLNRLFNTLSWTMTEFSVSIREMQEKHQVSEFQQRKCCVVFDLSCNLARLLEFCTCEIPQAFISGTDTNLRRLTELIVFILNHITSAADAEFFDLSFRRHGQLLEKVSRCMILAPLMGIILNLLDANVETESGGQNDIVDVFASMDCPDTMHCGFQYLLEYNWQAGSLRGDAYLGKLGQLENFLSLLISRIEVQQIEKMRCGETDGDDGICCICYTCKADAKFIPCSHISCYGCITRHLLNCHRCFFCNATVLKVIKMDENRI
ncbi:E3 ubiquitin-protein ligase RKP-like isoform X11 [Manihot esculenta]|uniref:E3 ubiquitin-protein ligase RKP-like isoform X11 n=1 Tax=Manihot esculenta TaxID=3983 RepID=UPI000B5D1329|nr:E3 ubiquitin-protein ligase RKP-like isoform X11 [Manihot esculenta]